MNPVNLYKLFSIKNIFIFYPISLIKYTSGARQWNYQCCTQFGWWQTAQNNSQSLRSSEVDINFYKEFCSSVFAPNYWPNADLVNFMYGGD